MKIWISKHNKKVGKPYNAADARYVDFSSNIAYRPHLYVYKS